MKANLISIYSFAIAAFMLSSCGSEDPAGGGQSAGSVVSFAVSDQTRATETPDFDRFVVYGDMKFPADNSATPTVIFNNTEVVKKNNIWSYDDVRYWYPAHEHSFVALCPVSLTSDATAARYSDSRLSLTYYLPAEAGTGLTDKDGVEDILSATHRRVYNSDDPVSAITFRFGHIMSRVNFTVTVDDNNMTEQEYMEFHDIELTGFGTKATFGITPAPLLSNNQTDDRTIDVKGLQGNGRMSVKFTTPIRVLNTRENVSIFDSEAAIIMLPQDFAADSEAKVVFTYTINDEPTIKKVTLPLKTQKWESGKSYNYRFTISRTGPKFETTIITDWDMTDVGNIDAH